MATPLKINSLIPTLYLGVVVLLSTLPINGPGSAMNDIYVVHLRLDYLLHGLLFLPVPLFVNQLVLRSKYHDPQTPPNARTRTFPSSRFPFPHFPMIVILSLLFAILCEIVQFPLPYRAFNVNDLIANAAGSVVGSSVIPLVSSGNRQ